MHLWDWRSGYNFQKLNSIAQPGSINSEAGIFALAFDRSGSRLVSAEADKTVKIYKEDETAVILVMLCLISKSLTYELSPFYTILERGNSSNQLATWTIAKVKILTVAVFVYACAFFEKNS